MDTKQESDGDEEDDDDGDDDDDEEHEDIGADWMKLINLDSEFEQLYGILHATMKGGDNTSVLLFGRNGFGKSALLSLVIHRLAQKYGKQSFIYIYLNAHLHTTDVESLYEIVSQILHANGRTFAFDLNNDANSEARSNHTVTQKLKKTDFVNNLDFLVTELKKVSMDKDCSGTKPIYIVLDHFELFAKRHKQTLLYNLFELNQSPSSRLNIIGITDQKSVYELLEKRIRSRFVHKKIFVPDESILAQHSFQFYVKLLYDALRVKHHYASGSAHSSATIRAYNDWIDDALLSTDTFRQYLRRLHGYGSSPATFLIIAAMITAIVFSEQYYRKQLSDGDIKKLVNRIDAELFSDPFLRMIQSLSMNELLMLIVAVKYDVTKNEAFNFEILYKTLQNVQKQDSMMIIMKKHIYFECYRQLIQMQFLVPMSAVNKISASTSDNLLHENFEMVRLNKAIDSRAQLLRFISQNIPNLPAWMNSWLLNNKTHICL
eukprot:CAMPEP_0202690770 /NCGR_PEP_ID=MMETSP1385-20130828/5658_1 /ASSEMBLY_ACC=CAM_ASM_000861 /TAXON_ID=933848 /ORGANISM="Elphidium margaritaceum" /LENGTH=488 /DNA_ID=CAMNT_0049346063 /DNA_START=226 /DNA_END=1692 /DNA_ORIENTATION=-